MTAYEESAAGLVYPRTSLPLLERGADLSIALLENRIRQLELQLDEQGWTQLDGSIGSEFTRDGLKKIVELARIYY
jgi:flagellar basal body rod protein FlgF